MADHALSVQRSGFDALVLSPLLLFLIFSPFYDSIGVPVGQSVISLMDWQRLSELLAVCLVLVVLCLSVWPVRRAYYSLPAVQILGWLCFFSTGAVSCVFAEHFRFAWVEWSWLLICFLVAVLLSLQALRDTDSAGLIVKLWTLSVLASYTPLYYIRNSDNLFEALPLSGPILFGFTNIRVFSDYQTAVVCLLPWALRNVSPSSAIRVGAWALAGCYVALAFVVGSRSLFFGQLIAATFIFFSLGGQTSTAYIVGQLRLWIVAAVVFAFLFLIFPILFFDVASQSTPFQLRTDSSGRMVLWESALQIGLNNPWLGVGPMHYAAIPNAIAASPHNQILQIVAEFGIVAAVLFFFLVFHWLSGVSRGVRDRISNMSGDERLFPVSLLAGFVALLAQSCVSPVFNNPHSQVLLLFLGAVLGGYIRWTPGGMMFSIRRPIVVLASFLALYIFFWSCLPWAAHIAERNSCYLASEIRPTVHFAPRFWQQGWLFNPCEPAF